MGAWLGKNKKQQTTRVTTATADPKVNIERLKTARNRLSSHCELIELNLESNRDLAKQKLREGSREEAKTFIRKKIYNERQLQRSTAQLDKIDQITNELELARLARELSNIGGRTVKRGRWRSIIKRNHHKRRDSKKYGKSVEDSENQVLGALNKKERDKRNIILKEMKKGVAKQRRIDELLSGQLRKGDETAVEKELEEILNSGYQLPDMDQDNAYKKTLQNTNESEDVTAISA